MKNESVMSFEVESKWMMEGEFRLNASSFSPEAAKSLILLEELKNNGIEIERIGNLVDDIYYPGRFKRIYSREGKNFLSSKDIFDFLFGGKKIRNASGKYLIEPGYLLVTRSGSVGRSIISNRIMSESAISEHVIRIIPNEKTPIGYIHAYLISRIGQPLILKNIFGGVVDEIEPHHLAKLPIPRLNKFEKDLNKKILQVFKLREEAQQNLTKAINMVYMNLELERIDPDDGNYFGGNLGKKVRSFLVNSSELDFRIDASYHTPIAHYTIDTLRGSKKGTLLKLGDIADTFVPPRFKRAYVKDPSDGIPLLQGTHVPQIKPQDLKFLWKDMKNLEKYKVKKNWILVTCSGTIGRLSLLRDYWDGWLATNHLLRIIPNEEKIHPGYLTAFLLSSYGQVLFQRLIYGGVVDEIGEAGKLFNEVPIIKPKDNKIEKEIGGLVFEAYDKRDKANKIEKEAIKLLEDELVRMAGDVKYDHRKSEN